ncbi:MAG: 16S rRNA (adenine(1518)-N(6)/adenine(1519)-N(6))-dimethyltransferase RsmA [Planctomycetota bacterium]|nr:16S rRNA (adenine(1518)-N(6)/adenine(1519)-N(6))-dimethyltransferase RsmA [Planctomycetota bacterium]
MARARTWRELKDLLRNRGFRPNKRLGQNFLLSPDALSTIVQAADVKQGDKVVEVGVGAGTLTGHLLDAGAEVLGIEVDRKLVGVTNEQFGDYKRLELMLQSVMGKGKNLGEQFLSRLRSLRASGGYKLVANLPYNISTPLLCEIMREDVRPSRMSVLVQKDFAARLCSEPGSKNYSPVSVYSAVFGHAKVVQDIPPELFWPVPAVKSSVVAWVEKDEPPRFDDEDLFFDLVAGMFLMRRKKLSNVMKMLVKVNDSLSGILDVEALEKAGIDPDSRVESVPSGRFVKLYEVLRG